MCRICQQDFNGDVIQNFKFKKYKLEERINFGEHNYYIVDGCILDSKKKMKTIIEIYHTHGCEMKKFIQLKYICSDVREILTKNVFEDIILFNDEEICKQCAQKNKKPCCSCRKWFNINSMIKTKHNNDIITNICSSCSPIICHECGYGFYQYNTTDQYCNLCTDLLTLQVNFSFDLYNHLYQIDSTRAKKYISEKDVYKINLMLKYVTRWRQLTKKTILQNLNIEKSSQEYKNALLIVQKIENQEKTIQKFSKTLFQPKFSLSFF